MIAAKVGSIRVVGQEMLQEGSEVVSMPQCQVGTEHVLVHQAQVEVVAEGVHVHQVTDLVTLLREQHGQLRRNSGGGLRVWGYRPPNPSWAERKFGSASCCCGNSLSSQGLWGTFPFHLVILCCTSLLLWNWGHLGS